MFRLLFNISKKDEEALKAEEERKRQAQKESKVISQKQIMLYCLIRFYEYSMRDINRKEEQMSVTRT